MNVCEPPANVNSEFAASSYPAPLKIFGLILAVIEKEMFNIVQIQSAEVLQEKKCYGNTCSAGYTGN